MPAAMRSSPGRRSAAAMRSSAAAVRSAATAAPYAAAVGSLERLGLLRMLALEGLHLIRVLTL